MKAIFMILVHLCSIMNVYCNESFTQIEISKNKSENLNHCSKLAQELLSSETKYLSDLTVILQVLFWMHMYDL